jgi:hypothetical protein
LALKTGRRYKSEQFFLKKEPKIPIAQGMGCDSANAQAKPIRNFLFLFYKKEILALIKKLLGFLQARFEISCATVVPPPRLYGFQYFADARARGNSEGENVTALKRKCGAWGGGDAGA